MTPIGHYHCQLPEKFGVPRQSGLVPALQGEIHIEKAWSQPEAFRGLEGFSHLWIIWEFSGALQTPYRPTVRPPRLGGNERLGVFATRSPFRPNHLGLSAVRYLGHSLVSGHMVVRVAGADLMDNTPVWDIKPYIPYADSIPEASGGFTATTDFPSLDVYCPDALRQMLTPEQWDALRQILAQDPRPAYQRCEQRDYTMAFDRYQVQFRVEQNILNIINIK